MWWKVGLLWRFVESNIFTNFAVDFVMHIRVDYVGYYMPFCRN